MHCRHIFLFLLLLVSFCACGGSTTSTGPESTSPSSFETELNSLAVPDGLDPAVWEELKTEFRRVMAAAGTEHRPARVADSSSSTVSDLVITPRDDGSATLDWSYRSQGDYNQDKLVAVSDFTEVGRYFNAKESDANWDRARLADGKDDGMITVSDITPLGANYNCRISGYWIFTTATPTVDGSWATCGEVGFEEGYLPDGEHWLRFTAMIAEPVDGNYYAVAPVDDLSNNELGNRSNSAQFIAVNPSITVDVPANMLDGAEATWEASWTNGTPPFDVSFDLGGGGTNGGMETSESTASHSSVMVNSNPTAPTSYTYTVTVTDSEGHTGTATDQYSVGPASTPEVTVTVPSDMLGGVSADWEAQWTGGVGPYEITWGFDGGATDIGPTVATSPDIQTVTMLNDSRTEPATYTYLVTVEDSVGQTGTASAEFTVGANPHPAVTVTVPGEMYGGVEAGWQATWAGGSAPYEITWEFGGGAADYGPVSATSPAWRMATMVNPSYTEAAGYTYTVTVTDGEGYSGVASGSYDVGLNQVPVVQVQVPTGMSGNADATWSATWTQGTAPYEITWEFDGGATDSAPAAATSPCELIRTMLNPSTTTPAQYTYTVTVTEAQGAAGVATGNYTVGPKPSDPPVITLAEYTLQTSTLLVKATDPDDGETLTVTVTEPTGLHADLATKTASSTGPLSASFIWSANDPLAGGSGTTTVTVEDSAGETDTTTVEITVPALGTLYAIPQTETVGVGDPVTILVTTDYVGYPFLYLNMVGLTVEPGANLVSGSFNIGAIGGAANESDGIWTLMGATSFYSSGVNWHGDNGDGLERWEIAIFPNGTTIQGVGGDLFNLQFSFDTPGTYHLGFVQQTGFVKRTYYSDLDEYEYFWGDVSNDHSGIANTIVVTE